MKRLSLTCATAQVLCALSAQADGFATWNANSGALSYTVINLSGQSCNLTAYGATSNASAPASSPANVLGWNGQPLDSDVPNDGWGFFNGMGEPKDNYSNRVIFYNSPSPIQQIYNFFGHADDSTSWAVSNPQNFPYPSSGGKPLTLSNGSNLNFIEPTIEFGSAANPAAVGDSWTIACDQGQTAVMANLASAADSLGSGVTNDAYSYFTSNAQINPPAPGNFGTWSSTNPPSGNVNGMGFVSSESMVMNLNQDPGDANYQPTGGLWWGVENPNTQATFSLVPAMLPVNLSSYTVAQQETNLGNTQYQTYIYGGHLTYTIGDPFIISSFAAKTLWYLATSTSFFLNDDTFDSDATSNGVDAFEKAVNGGLFPSSSYALNYLETLMQSTGQAAYAVKEAIYYASQPNDHESFWGKLFAGLFNVTMTAIDAGVVVATGGESKVAQVAIQTSVVTATGGLTPVVDNSINSAFTTNTTMGTPATQAAPLVFNTSFASSNLFGLLLTNFFVQYQLNTATGNATNPNPLWSNSAAYADGYCTNMGVTDNVFDTSITCNDSSGDPVEQIALNPAPNYTNVCEQWHSKGGCANAGSTGDSQLNIWDAILTGSNVGANDSGMLILQSPGTWSFQPPTQIADFSIAAIDTNFNLNTGALTMTGYTDASEASTAEPTIIPYTENISGGRYAACNSLIYSPGGVSYTYGTDSGGQQVVLTVAVATYTAYCQSSGDAVPGSDWPLPNGPVSLAINTCAAGSLVNFAPTPQLSTSGSNQGYPSGLITSAALECETPNPTVATSVVLDYNQCVSDPNATGGVVAATFSDSGSQTPGLGCVCMPGYLKGNSASLTTGYYSTGPKTAGKACAAP